MSRRPARHREARRSAVAAVLSACLWGLTNPPAEGADVDFYRDVYPILRANCVACHNKTTTRASLNMETPESLRKGGASGPGVIPAKAEESPVYQAAAHTGDVEMPPKGNKSGAVKLSPVELASLKAWIDQGARDSVQQAPQVTWRPLPPGIHPIYSAAVTRDGRYAACGRANGVFVYDLASRKLVARLVDEALGGAAAHRSLVQCVAFSTDGTKLASGGFRQVKIWRRNDATPRARRADAALGSVVSAISEDGTRVVCADAKGALHALDAESGKTLGTIPGLGKAAPVLLALSPDATRAAVYSADGSLALFSLAEGKRLGGKEAVPGVRALAWARDGNAVITGGDDKAVRLWPLPSGDQAELAPSKEFPGATGPVIALDCSAGPDLLIAATADGNVRVWDVAEAKLVRAQALPGVVSIRLSGDGKRFVAGRADGSVQVWDLAIGKAIADLSGDAETEARLAALDEAAAAGALEAAFQVQEAARIEAESKGLDDLLKKAGEKITTLRRELADARKAREAAVAARVAAQKALDAALQAENKAAADGLAAATGKEAAATLAAKAAEIHLRDAEAESESYTATRTRNGAAVAAANAAATKAKDAQSKATADSAAIRQAVAARGLRPLAVCFSPDSTFVGAVYGDGSLRAWAVASARPVTFLPGGPPSASASIAAEPDGTFSASLADGSTARLPSSPRWGLLRTIGDDSAASPFSDRVNAVRFSPDGQTLATGGGEPTRSGDISLWDVSDGRLIREWKERHSDAVLSLDFSADGKSLASGGADRLARVTEIATGKVTRLFEGHTHHVLGVSFRADGRVLATAGADGAVTAWDMISGERKKKVEGWSKEVTAVQFIGATNQMVTSSADNLIRIVDDNGSEIRVVARVSEFLQTAGAASTARLVLGGGEDGVLRVWDGTTGQSLAAFPAEPEAGTPTAAPGGAR